MKNLLFVLIILFSIKMGISQSSNDFLNFNYIVYNKEYKIEIDSASKEWGKKVLQDLKIENLNNFEKAEAINNYLNENFKYIWKRRLEIEEIIEKKNGFCISHALMGIFLLRQAGIPAKFAHEVHIMKEHTILSLMIGRYAKKDNDGINSYWHNDHVWVWFSDGENWEPFDSALDLCGFDEFYEKRFFKQKELSKSFAQKWTGPPFVIWEDSGSGLQDMRNISTNVWNEKSIYNESTINDDWLELVKLFSDWNEQDFYKEYLDNEKINKIKEMSKDWF